MWICIKIQKIRLFHRFLLEILSINKILQPDWLRIFWPISQMKKISQIGDLSRNTENNIYFHYRTISVNINTKFFNKLKKTLFLAHFWNIFPIFGADRILLKNLALSRTTSYSFLVLCQNLEKNNNTILRKRLDRRKDKRKDRKTYRPCFIGSFWLPLVVQQGQLHWNTFKSQRYREGYWSNQKLLDYCQHAKNLPNT